MADCEKVIKGLETLIQTYGCRDTYYMDCKSCVYNDDPHCVDSILSDAVSLLKEHKPIEARLHLCESCTAEYPECAATSDDIEFGCGVGNDNVIGCRQYVNRWTFRPTYDQMNEAKL